MYQTLFCIFTLSVGTSPFSLKGLKGHLFTPQQIHQRTGCTLRWENPAQPTGYSSLQPSPTSHPSVSTNTRPGCVPALLSEGATPEGKLLEPCNVLAGGCSQSWRGFGARSLTPSMNTAANSKSQEEQSHKLARNILAAFM